MRSWRALPRAWSALQSRYVVCILLRAHWGYLRRSEGANRLLASNAGAWANKALTL